MEDDQERYLDDALKSVKAQSFHIHTEMEKNNVRHTLKETSNMLIELKSTILSPRSYYSLYSSIFDEMLNVNNFFKEEAKRGRKMTKLYDVVQQASNIIPRLYLMATVGSVLVENEPTKCKEILFDLLGMIKGVQNPTRGLFARYYLLKMMKDRLPDKGNEYETENCSVTDTLNFILQNLDEMNSLWIRLSSNCIGGEKIQRDKERQELRLLIGENITRLSQLEGLTLQMYQDQILPKIIEILSESKDALSQYYLMECLIQAFPDEYNIHCMSTILNTTKIMVEDVDVKSLLIGLMSKLARYVTDNKDNKDLVVEEAEQIFGILKESIDHLINSSCNSIGGISEPNKLIELQLAFIKFTIKCCPKNERLDTVNHILGFTLNILNAYNRKLNDDGEKALRNLLCVPLESELSLFELKHFPQIMVFLNFSARTTLALRIIDSLSQKEKLDSSEKVDILLNFIRPLLEDSADTIEVDAYEFEYQQNVVAKMLFTISTHDPGNFKTILDALVPIFLKGGVRRVKYTLPTLANAYMRLASQLSETYNYKLHPEIINNPDITEIQKDFLEFLNLDTFDSEETVINFVSTVHTKINEILQNLVSSYPEIAFKTYILAMSNLNCMRFGLERFVENAKNYLECCFKIYKEGNVNQKDKLLLLNQLSFSISSSKLLPTEELEKYADEVRTLGEKMSKRAEQCSVMLFCADVFFGLGNAQKTRDCMKKSKKYAAYAMTNPENLKLFCLILNKYLGFIENTEGDEYFFNKEDIEDIIEEVRNHIITICNENNDKEFLPEIQKYFEDTISVYRRRKTENKKQIYAEINIESEET